MTAIIRKGYNKYSSLCRKAYVSCTTGAVKHLTAFMLVFGVGILAVGLNDLSLAQPGLGVEEGDERIEIVTTRLFKLVEGNAGSLIMVLAGLGAIISAAFGAYRAAVGLLVVAVGAFILRALVDIFFNYDENDV